MVLELSDNFLLRNMKENEYKAEGEMKKSEI